MSDVLLVIYVDVAKVEKAVFHHLLLILEPTAAEGAPKRPRSQIRLLRRNLKTNVTVFHQNEATCRTNSNVHIIFINDSEG